MTLDQITPPVAIEEHNRQRDRDNKLVPEVCTNQEISTGQEPSATHVTTNEDNEDPNQTPFHQTQENTDETPSRRGRLPDIYGLQFSFH